MANDFEDKVLKALGKIQKDIDVLQKVQFDLEDSARTQGLEQRVQGVKLNKIDTNVRRFEVLQEQTDGKIDHILESFGETLEKTTKHEESIGEHETRITRLEQAA